MVYKKDTIAAISTPLGQGGIGIVRLSGPHALKIADIVFKAKNNKSINNTASHRLIYGRLLDAKTNQDIDEAIVTTMRAPRSYTREDVVEINCHAGTVVLKTVLEAVLAAGCRLAEPGEFTKRAFLNGRVDLAQAEGVSALITAQTKEAARVATQQLAGNLSRAIRDIRHGLLRLLAQVEAAVDFADEDIEVPDISAIAKQTKIFSRKVEALLKTSAFGKVLQSGLRTVIVGRTNVGKSSLFNRLIREDRAIVTEIPGTTRDLIDSMINIDGVPVLLRDTAGFRDPKDQAEQAGVELSAKAIKLADLVLFVVDGSNAITDDDLDIIANFDGRPTILIINKNDLPVKISLEKLKEFPCKKTVKTSAINETGIKQLRLAIADIINEYNSVAGDIIVANVRHEKLLKKCGDSLNSTLEAIKAGFTEEVLAQTLKEAYNYLGDILGEHSYNELINEIFSQFCIGK